MKFECSKCRKSYTIEEFNHIKGMTVKKNDNNYILTGYIKCPNCNHDNFYYLQISEKDFSNSWIFFNDDILKNFYMCIKNKE